MCLLSDPSLCICTCCSKSSLHFVRCSKSDLFFISFSPCKLDYDRKAENAVDYEDIDEQYDGPEVETATEEDFLLPKKDFFSKEVPLTSLENTISVFDDENYDEEEEDSEKQSMMVESNVEAQLFSPSGLA